jgi:hypothetical protein
MVVKFKKGKLTADGMQVTDSQNDTVGIVAWAGAFGHNLQQVSSGTAVLPALPVTDSSTGVEGVVPIRQWGWVLITSDDDLIAVQSSEELEALGWKTVEDPTPEPS